MERLATHEAILLAARIELQSIIGSIEVYDDNKRTTDKKNSGVKKLRRRLEALLYQITEKQQNVDTSQHLWNNFFNNVDISLVIWDNDLRVVFFTSSTNLPLKLAKEDIGRRISEVDLSSSDTKLEADALAILSGLDLIEREVEAPCGLWFLRRISPFRTDRGAVEGAITTFVDVTERKRTSKTLEQAKQQSELANRDKSRFVAAASHDLRQPLQTLTLLHGLLEKAVESDHARRLVARIEQTLDAMSGLLNTLLDINQIEVGIVQPEITAFALNDLLDRIKGEFSYHAHARSLALRVLPCSETIRSDQRLLEQMIRNLLSNALKYTDRGKVLLGCRRRGGMLSIEIWDTGIGIPHEELQAIFEEYHQVDKGVRRPGRGLGLGLSIVQRLANLLGHRVRVRSRRGRGSVFAIEIDLSRDGATRSLQQVPQIVDASEKKTKRQSGSILVVEDDPDLRDLLDVFLTSEGYPTITASNGLAAMELGMKKTARPDIIIADYNLPGELNGLRLAARFREMLDRNIPVIILTGDISTETLRDVAFQQCVQLSKPVKLKELTNTIERLMANVAVRSRFSESPDTRTDPASSTVFIVDDDMNLCDALREMCQDLGRTASIYPSSECFLAHYKAGSQGCILIDAYLPGMSGIELLQRLRNTGDQLPAIMITGSSDVTMAVEAMKAGASDFIEKPIGRNDLLASIERALEQSRDGAKLRAWRDNAVKQISELTLRQRQVMDMVLAGHPSKNIAADLGISQRTVENHRAAIMKKTGARSLPDLARLALAAERGDAWQSS